MIRIYPVRRTLHPRHVFRIARASRPQVDNLFLSVEQDGVIGYGEASPNAYFREDPGDVHLALSGLQDYFRRQTLRRPARWRACWKRSSSPNPTSR